ncbi:hypothetical protein G7068_12985 [Leucobacter viscericola]|uniref:Lipoprotein n=1 Tax=Leucobacter viscericola TaxID=2714935 RepID=A0A6G7XHM3_9MICO|nr:hypothetical protein [Leucobacter viscericola]QIK64012.1 hypothetical protein G7068_12985 [Leucobacter viscericola]
MKNLRTTAVTSAVGAALLLGLTLTGCAAGSNPDVPKGVPTAVATVQGEVSNKASSSPTNWSYSVEVDSKKAQDEAITKLKDNGFKVTGDNEQNGTRTYALTNDKEKVNVTVVLTKQDKKFLVIYNIAKL